MCCLPLMLKISYSICMKKTRALFLWSHRWFGIIAGFYYVLLGLTGSYLVYRDEIEALSFPQLHRAEANVASWNLERLITAGKAGLETDKDPSGIYIPADHGRTVELSFNMSKPGAGRKIITGFVDPSNDQFVGSMNFRESLSGFIFIFHHDLFLGGLGRTIVGVAGILMLFILASGMYLWWPKKGAIKKGFTLKTIRNRLQWNIEWHRLTGLYSLVLMVVVTFSGVFIAKPGWFINREGGPGGLGGGSGGGPGGAPRAGSERKADPISINWSGLQFALEDHALAQRPINLRINSEKSYIDVSKDGDVFRFDMVNAKLIDKNPPKPPAAEMHELQKDLHGGHYWGELGRFLTFVSGILPLFFYVSGIYIWLKKRSLTNRTQKVVHP